MGLAVEVLESDAVRRVITPMPTYSESERDLFSRSLVFTGQRLVAHGVTVVFNATASRRVYRGFARSVIPSSSRSPWNVLSRPAWGETGKGPIERASWENLSPFPDSNLPTKRRSTRISESTSPLLTQEPQQPRSACGQSEIFLASYEKTPGACIQTGFIYSQLSDGIP